MGSAVVPARSGVGGRSAAGRHALSFSLMRSSRLRSALSALDGPFSAVLLPGSSGGGPSCLRPAGWSSSGSGSSTSSWTCLPSDAWPAVVSLTPARLVSSCLWKSASSPSGRPPAASPPLAPAASPASDGVAGSGVSGPSAAVVVVGAWDERSDPCTGRSEWRATGGDDGARLAGPPTAGHDWPRLPASEEGATGARVSPRPRNLERARSGGEGTRGDARSRELRRLMLRLAGRLRSAALVTTSTMPSNQAPAPDWARTGGSRGGASIPCSIIVRTMLRMRPRSGRAALRRSSSSSYSARSRRARSSRRVASAAPTSGMSLSQAFFS